jgi:ABC-2 type transport system ATP-binding protein
MLLVLPGVRFVESIPSQELPPNRCLIRVVSEPGTEPARDIAAVLIGAGVALYEMRRTRASLEDVFIELTTQEKVVDMDTDETDGNGTSPPSPAEAAAIVATDEQSGGVE